MWDGYVSHHKYTSPTRSSRLRWEWDSEKIECWEIHLTWKTITKCKIYCTILGSWKKAIRDEFISEIRILNGWFVFETRFVYEITRTWNDLPIDHDAIQMTLMSREDGDLQLMIAAPFFNDPPNPGGPPGEPFYGLWDYEGIHWVQKLVCHK